MRFTKTHEQEYPIIVNGRRTRNFICLVDAYRRPSRMRNTAGRYRVGAKNAKQARRLLQRAIGFGSVMVYYEDSSEKLSDLIPFGVCVREDFNPSTHRYDQSPVRHATDRVKNQIKKRRTNYVQS